MDETKKRPLDARSPEPNKRPFSNGLPFSTRTSAPRMLKSSPSSVRPSNALPVLTASYMTSIASKNKQTFDPSINSPDILAPQPLQKVEIAREDETAHSSSFLVPTTDYTIKTELLFTSSESFDWINLCGSQHRLTPTTKPDSPAEIFSQALFYYQYPANPIPKSIINSETTPTNSALTLRVKDSNKGVAPLSFVESLRASWTRALASLTDIVCSQPNSSFHMLASDFTMVLKHEHGVPTASINKTTAVFRKRLATEGVEFCLPLEPPHPSEEEEVQLDKEDERIARRAKLVGAIDYDVQSMVLIIGEHKVRTLVDFVLKAFAGSEIWLGDFPVLLSDLPFENATIKRLSPKISSASILNGSSTSKVWTLTLNGGYTLPEPFVKMVSAVQAQLSLTSSVSISCKTLTGTEWSGIQFYIIPDTSILAGWKFVEEGTDQNRRPSIGKKGADTIDKVTVTAESITYQHHIPQIAYGSTAL